MAKQSKFTEVNVYLYCVPLIVSKLNQPHTIIQRLLERIYRRYCKQGKHEQNWRANTN